MENSNISYFCWLLKGEAWVNRRVEAGGGELMGKKTGKCTRNIVYMSLPLKFKRNPVHIQFHVLRPCGEFSLQMFPKQMKSCWCENRAATVHRTPFSLFP